MSHPRLSSAWLSNDMAHALAASCPPLETSDVIQAADKLAARGSPKHVMGNLLQQGADLLKVRRVVEALRALRDVRQ
jgi:hypothetical protein